MYNFHLFRIKAERREHHLFTDDRLTPPILIQKAISERLSKEVRKKQTWRLGNSEKIGDHANLFAFGKVLKSKRDVYDEEEGNFTEVDDTDAPHTCVIVDIETQVCAIAHKSSMNAQVKDVGNNLAKVLSSTKICEEQSVTITISPINDPDDFIRLIEQSEQVSMFEMTFSPPNPFDVDKDFHRPMEKLLESANAGEGKTRIKGQKLDKEVVKELARSAISAGNDASAKVKMPGDEKASLKKIAGRQKTVQADDIVTGEEKHKLLARIRQVYSEIRGRDQ